MTFAQGIIIGLSPVVVGWFGLLTWVLVSDHNKHKLHDERMMQLQREFGVLEERVHQLETGAKE